MRTRIALTGGIASGKSTVADLFAERGAVIVDSDLIARQVVEPGTPGLRQVVERFGPAVLTADGHLERPALGRIVFEDEAARRDLEGILHPLIQQESLRQQQAAWAAGRTVIRMIPLLVEAGMVGQFDEVIVVDVLPQVQLRRLMARNGGCEQDARARIASQASREERLAVATHVIDNNGAPEALGPQVDAVWEQLAR